jgi:hypothetical protein
VQRLVIADTVEDRVLALQDRKVGVRSPSFDVPTKALYRKHSPMAPSGKARARKSEVSISFLLLHNVTFKRDGFFTQG